MPQHQHYDDVLLVYSRARTAQAHEDQLVTIRDYAHEELNAGVSRLDFAEAIRDVTLDPRLEDIPVQRPPDLSIVYDHKHSPRDAVHDRVGYQYVKECVEKFTDKIRALLVPTPGVLTDSIRDLQEVLDTMSEAGIAVHFVEDGWVRTPGDPDSEREAARRAMLRELADAEADGERDVRIREVRERDSVGPAHRGRPPLGYTVSDGELVPDEDYEEIVAVLSCVAAEEMPKTTAAERIDTTRRTITRILDDPERRAMYFE